MRQRDWIVTGLAAAILVAGIGIGIATRYGRASQRPSPGPTVPPHQQRAAQAGQAAAQRARVVRRQRVEALRSFEKMPSEQQRQLVADQVHSTLEPNAPPRQAVLAADQNEVARQILEKVRDMTPEQRRQYLRKLIEQERARLAGRRGVDPNRGPADTNAQVGPAPAQGVGQGQAAAGQ